MKHIYIFYRLNRYPDCHEASELADSVWTDKKLLNMVIKEKAKNYPALYGEGEYKIEKVRINKMMAL